MGGGHHAGVDANEREKHRLLVLHTLLRSGFVLLMLLHLGTLHQILFAPFRLQCLAVQALGVQREGAPGNESRRQHDDGENGELHAGDVLDSEVDILVVLGISRERHICGGVGTGVADAVNVPPEKWAGDGVDDDVGAIKESHDGPKRRHIVRLTLLSLEESLNVGGERDISGGPAERDRDKCRGDDPCVADPSDRDPPRG